MSHWAPLNLKIYMVLKMCVHLGMHWMWDCLGGKGKHMSWQEGREGDQGDWKKQSYLFQNICESKPQMNALWAWEMPQLLPPEQTTVAAAAKQVWRDKFFTAKAVSRGLLRENRHITQWNIKSREFYGHKDLGSVYGYELLMPSEALWWWRIKAFPERY